MVTVCCLPSLTLGTKLKLDSVLLFLCARTLEDYRKQTNPFPDYHLDWCEQDEASPAEKSQGGVGAPRMKAVRSMWTALPASRSWRSLLVMVQRPLGIVGERGH